MGAGNVKKIRKTVKIEESEDQDSFENYENKDKLDAVMAYDNDELAEHDDLLIQASFCNIPAVKADLYQYERNVLSKLQ